MTSTRTPKIIIQPTTTALTGHIFGENGLGKAQALDCTFLTGSTTTNPDSIYGCLKSAILVQLVMIAMSPIAASKVYMEQENKKIRRTTFINKLTFMTLTPIVIKRTSSVQLGFLMPSPNGINL